MLDQDNYLKQLADHQALFSKLDQFSNEVHALAQLCVESLHNGGKIIFLGNGGSAADSQHLAAEFVVRFRRERQALPSIALTTDTSILTACANDYSYDHVFARQIEALCKDNDVVIGLSTSGQSPNVNMAMEAANRIGAATVAFTGKDGGKIKDISKYAFIMPSNETARIQEAHMFIGHWLCDAVDCAFAEGS